MTDASICKENQLGAYGFWVVSPRSKRAGNGSFTEPTQDSTIGELRAVIYSLATALNNKDIQPLDDVLVQLDNLTAIDILRGTLRPEAEPTLRKGKPRLVNRPEVAYILDVYRKLKYGNHLNINFRHVKGHSRKNDNRSMSNNHCDRLAKAALQIAREIKRKT